MEPYGSPYNETPLIHVPKAFARQLERELNKTKQLYLELLMEVSRKFDNEDRHATALRYIREAEARAMNTQPCDATCPTTH